MAAPRNVTGVGIIGCGNISTAYVNGCRAFAHLRLVAVADARPEAAQAKAAEHGLACAGSVEELLANPDIDVVVNLTVPDAHAAVSLAILAAGKHVYSEKPLAIERADGRAILDAAAARGLRVGCAPDTFLGGGLQTCRQLIDDGAIGQPLAAVAFMLGHGPESWHPNPAFFYRRGAGPLFDMGPYYLTALIHLLGPVERVAAMARASFAERVAEREVPRLHAGAGENEIAKARKAGHRFRAGAERETETRHFREAARDERGAGAVAESACRVRCRTRSRARSSPRRRSRHR